MYFQKPKVSIPYIAGYEESIFLNKLGVKLREIETLANRATEVRWFFNILF